MIIPYELKRKCVEARDTMTAREIYQNIFVIEHDSMSFETFKRKLYGWTVKNFADNQTLSAGTYEGFTAHNATVQVDGKGNIRQAWIKQQVSDSDFEKLKEIIAADIKPMHIETEKRESAKKMLEIPLFDMHFGIASIEDYKAVISQICEKINSAKWEEINIAVGQDLIHNNDMRGHTAKGTEIESVNIPQAWEDAFCFWVTVIETAIKHADKVNLIYSVGNHDECMSWCFVQALKAKFPQISVDDSMKPRKAIYWRGCFIGLGHCDYTNSLNKIFHDFVIDFPHYFADANVREIHTGHLHRESEDVGIMVRRLATGKPSDKWHDNNGYIGSHKRFQLFVWEENWLSEVMYV